MTTTMLSKEQLIEKIIAKRTENIAQDALDCTSWEEEISSLLRRGSPDYSKYSVEQLKAELREVNESTKTDEIETDDAGNCVYCGQRCYEGDMCDEQQAGGFKE